MKRKVSTIVVLLLLVGCTHSSTLQQHVTYYTHLENSVATIRGLQTTVTRRILSRMYKAKWLCHNLKQTDQCVAAMAYNKQAQDLTEKFHGVLIHMLQGAVLLVTTNSITAAVNKEINTARKLLTNIVSWCRKNNYFDPTFAPEIMDLRHELSDSSNQAQTD